MGNKTLVVVESPSKAKTINKYLGKNFIVEASVGHIKDLSTYKLGVDLENQFKPDYKTVRGKADLIKKLKKISKESQEVLIATDPDREGEAIAFHIAEEVRKTNDNVHRVLFNEITKNGIKKGIEAKRDLDMNLYESQQARRVMDRLIGFKISPFLSKAMLTKTTKTLSAGRVQSVALRLICDREYEIEDFQPVRYWNINADFSKIGLESSFNAKLVGYDNIQIKNPEGSGGSAKDANLDKDLRKKISKLHFIRSEQEAIALLKRINNTEFNIDDIKKTKKSRKPQAPFTTSSLQQEASKKLGFSNKKTMIIAQKLYEGIKLGSKGEMGLITYMRTDSVRLSPEAVGAARQAIATQYGEKYVPSSTPIYSSKSKNVQDAHEAIRPTTIDLSPSAVKEYLDKEDFLLYQLIYNRFLASQMEKAEFEQTSIVIVGDGFEFRLTGSIMLFDGYLRAYDDDDKESIQILPEGLYKSDELNLENSEQSESQTKPPPRFNSASLVKELDERGIGRPSTYASIVSTLIDREYIEISNKAFSPTQLGLDVSEVLVKNFPDLFDVSFTADMELNLDKIAEGDDTYIQAMSDFYQPFSNSLRHAEEHGDFPVMKCELCETGEMEIKVGRNGRFLGCSNYPECRNTKPLPRVGGNEVVKEPVKVEGLKCPVCGNDMYLRDSRFGRFYGCQNYPECKGTLQVTTNVKCPTCKTGDLVEKFSPRTKKKFWGCSNYPKCNHITNSEPIDKSCSNCGHYFVEVRYKKTQTGWDKFHQCPNCNDKVEITE